MKFKTYKSDLALMLNAMFNTDQSCFSYGTIEGVFMEKPDVFEILVIENKRPHNGHFQKFMTFITDYCKREDKKLAFLEIFNKGLYNKLVSEGFRPYKGTGLIKEFTPAFLFGAEGARSNRAGG